MFLLFTKISGPRKTSKTKTITIRLPEDIADEIEKLSSETNQTVSNIVREELIKLVRWDVHASQIGMIQVPVKLLNFLIKGKTEEEIDEISDLAHEQIKEWSLITKGSAGFNQYLESLKDFVYISGANGAHKQIIDEHIFEIRHDLSESWSLFGGCLLKKIFDEFDKESFDFKHGEGMLHIKSNLGKDFDVHDY